MSLRVMRKGGEKMAFEPIGDKNPKRGCIILRIAYNAIKFLKGRVKH